MWATFLVKVVRPLLLEAAGFIFNKHMMGKIEDGIDQRELKMNTVLTAIEKAETDEERKNLSIVLAGL